jgi:hypothetical protein
MSTEREQIRSNVDLGGTWLRDQKARILQRHLQFGRRLRIDVDSLLLRAASLSRAGGPRRASREDFMRRATVDAIAYCLRLHAADAGIAEGDRPGSA